MYLCVHVDGADYREHDAGESVYPAEALSNPATMPAT